MDQQKSGVTAVILGTMQDGGLPHGGCECPRCQAALAKPSLARYAASLAVIDRREAKTAVWIIDATPDIKWQLAMLAAELGPHPQRAGRIRQPDGIFLTHAHFGHIGGLPQLGPEAMAVRDLPLYATPELVKLLQETALWQPTVSRCLLRPIVPGSTMELAKQLSMTAIAVPHRDEWNVGTVTYYVEGPQKTLLYLPDIDSWHLWPEAQTIMETVDTALVDASFYSADELGGRPPVAHPLVPDTIRRFDDMPGQLILTHINHSNPILDENSPQHIAVIQAGAQIARRGLVIDL